MNFFQKVVGRIRKEITIAKTLAPLRVKILKKKRVPITIEYPLDMVPRYGHGKPVHKGIKDIFDSNREKYVELINSFDDIIEEVSCIPFDKPDDPTEPFWRNGWLGGFGALALYGIIAKYKPKRYLEVGSGNSTKFARKAVKTRGLTTKITSIDPCPRAEIDNICDAVIRKGLQNADLSLFEELESGDILFMDGSHYCFMNSDVTVFFLEILPKLKSGVKVFIDDIFLPEDYPPDWVERNYSEQYLLATLLLANSERYEVMLPCWYINIDEQLSEVRDNVLRKIGEGLGGVNGIWLNIN